MELNTFAPCLLSKAEEERLGGILVKARKVVERVSQEAYGCLKIREFRRDLYAPDSPLKKFLTPEDMVIIHQVHQIEGEVVNAFVRMVAQVAQSMVYTGRSHADLNDLIQEGNEIVLLSMMGYNGEQKMSTYFGNVIIRYLTDIARHEFRAKQKCTQVDMDGYDFEEQSYDDPSDSDSQIDIYTLEYAYAASLSKLTPLQRMVLELAKENHPSPATEAARRLVNPHTGKNYTRMAASNALTEARALVQKVYHQMVAYKQSKKSA
jgi:RNA polymerase sigma factor (sigma-70 family)